jgi:hypothetical protein
MGARLDDWENIIASEINGVPLPTMMDAVRQAAIEFCQRSRVDTRLVEDLDYEAAYPDVVVPDLDAHTTPAAVINVWSSYGRIEPATKRDLEALYPRGWAREATGTMLEVRRWYSPRPGLVRLVPKLTVDMPAELTLDVAWQPRRNAGEVADFLYEHFAKEIGYGAVALLHRHADAPYADATRASAYQMFFEQRIAEVADRGVAGHQKQRHRVVPPDL